MVWPKLFEKWIEAATATDDELQVRNLSRVYPEREPEDREQRMLETRSWRDPSNHWDAQKRESTGSPEAIYQERKGEISFFVSHPPRQSV
jgi:hypothetical protein